MISNTATLMLLASVALSLAACTPETGADEETSDAEAMIETDDGLELRDGALDGADLAAIAGLETLPSSCPAELYPVCATSGKTYANRCLATSAGEAVAYTGLCGADETRVELDRDAADVMRDQRFDVLADAIPELAGGV